MYVHCWSLAIICLNDTTALQWLRYSSDVISFLALWVGLAAQDFKFSDWLLMNMSHGGHSFKALLAGQAAVQSIAPVDWHQLLAI
jgi:hypothetical protein